MCSHDAALCVPKPTRGGCRVRPGHRLETSWTDEQHAICKRRDPRWQQDQWMGHQAYVIEEHNHIRDFTDMEQCLSHQLHSQSLLQASSGQHRTALAISRTLCKNPSRRAVVLIKVPALATSPLVETAHLQAQYSKWR